MGFYRVLQSMGVFGADAPSTLPTFATQGQLSPAQMLARYGIVCADVRAVLHNYLLERAPALEQHHAAEPGRHLGAAVLA
jgi:hypothetical protein